MGGKRILVVEDHTPLQMAIQGVLQAEGYTVVTAVDGAQALQVMEEAMPDLIVADIVMPGMDGYAFYHAVRSRSEWTSIPFIFLTAKAQREDVLKGKALGVEDYLVKPLDPESLLVTVRARLERTQAVQESVEARLDEIKRQIVTALGHEMRTPLTHIRGYTELALEDISSLSPDLLEEFLQGIDQGADRLTQLAEDFLLLIRLDTGQMEIDFRRLAKVHHDLGVIVERTVHRYAEQAAAKRVLLELDVESGLPPTRLSEPLFVDVLGRLVDNAIKFSAGEGKQVMVTVRGGQNWVEIAVADQGIGVLSEEIPHLFERFRQINRQKMEQQGVGLGLAIARELVHLHGGEILVTSACGVGSTFTIRLPLAEKG